MTYSTDNDHEVRVRDPGVRTSHWLLPESAQEFPGVTFSFIQPIEMWVLEMLTKVRGEVPVKLFGRDLQILNQHRRPPRRLRRA